MPRVSGWTENFFGSDIFDLNERDFRVPFFMVRRNIKGKP